jgi:phosphoribosylaminoimidazolecarboxamide formyltransferase/IMP cyclohydrolase
MNAVKVSRALVSVYDKAGLKDLIECLNKYEVKIVSSGGTAKAIRNIGFTCMDVSDYTGYPESPDGLVKTLHPKVHGGLLMSTSKPAHKEYMDKCGIPEFELVAVNLYPFSAAAAKPGATPEEVAEMIDIGGPAMVRAAGKGAKLHGRPCVVVDPADYQLVISEMEQTDGRLSHRTARRLAGKAYEHTADYDAAIVSYQKGMRVTPLKYGCNPYQEGATAEIPAGIEVLHGNPGFINWLDATNAYLLALELGQAFGMPAATSFKHTSPAGAAIGLPLDEALERAFMVKEIKSPVARAYAKARGTDPKSSFGDMAGFSSTIDYETAVLLKGNVVDGIIAPDFEPEALEILKTKKANKGGIPIIKVLSGHELPKYEERITALGIKLKQPRNNLVIDESVLGNVVTKNKELPPGARRDLILAAITNKYTQSNTIVYALGGQTTGVGAGQQSRVDCARLAGEKTDVWSLRQHPDALRFLDEHARLKPTERLQEQLDFIKTMPWNEKQTYLLDYDMRKNIAVSSDAFFPFPDGIEEIHRHSGRYILQPGGSERDADAIACADSHDMVMMFAKVKAPSGKEVMMRLFTH